MWTWTLRLPETPPAKCSWTSCSSCTFTKTDTRTPERHLLASVSFSLSDPSCYFSLSYSGALAVIRVYKWSHVPALSYSLDPFWFFQQPPPAPGSAALLCTCRSGETGSCIQLLLLFRRHRRRLLAATFQRRRWTCQSNSFLQPSGAALVVSSSEFGCALPQILTSLLQLQPSAAAAST